MVEDREYLFVYGTLMKGCPAHDLMKGSTFVSRAITSERHTLYAITSPYGDRYPALLLNGGEHYVIGELYLVPPEVLERLDFYEGVNEGDYIRTKIRVRRLDIGKEVEAYVYAINPSLLETLISEGRAEPLVSLEGDKVVWKC